MLAPLDEIKVCVAYEGEDGTRYEHVPYHQSVLHKVRPVYETLPGWRREIDGAERVDDLPGRGPRASSSSSRTLAGVPVTLPRRRSRRASRPSCFPIAA